MTEKDALDAWAALPAPPEPVQLVLEPPGTAHDIIKREEDKILGRAMRTVDSALAFSEVDGAQGDLPPQWMDMDPDEAQQKLRVARAAWLCKSEAPVGLDISLKVMVGIIKARAAEKQGPRTLNLIHVHTTAPMPDYEVVDVEAEDERRR